MGQFGDHGDKGDNLAITLTKGQLGNHSEKGDKMGQSSILHGCQLDNHSDNGGQLDNHSELGDNLTIT